MDKTNVLREIDNIKNQLIEKYKPEKFILFGSAAGGKGEVNDIGIFVIKSDVPYYGADRLLELYRLIKTDAPVDYIVYKPEEAEGRLSPGDLFIKKILREGNVLYG